MLHVWPLNGINSRRIGYRRVHVDEFVIRGEIDFHKLGKKYIGYPEKKAFFSGLYQESFA